MCDIAVANAAGWPDDLASSGTDVPSARRGRGACGTSKRVASSTPRDECGPPNPNVNPNATSACGADADADADGKATTGPSSGGRFGRLPEFVATLRIMDAERAERVDAIRAAIAEGDYDLDARCAAGLRQAYERLHGGMIGPDQPAEDGSDQPST